MAKSTITARLGRRQAVWNPGIPGFNGLNGIDPDGETTLTVDSEKSPELYAAVKKAIEYGVLVLPLKENDVKKESEVTTETETKVKEELPSTIKTARTLIETLSTDELLTKIENTTDIGLITSLMEQIMEGSSKSGIQKDKLKTAIRARIRVLEQPLE